MPVMLPPGRLRLGTYPLATGSPPIVKTIGIVWVAAFAVRTAALLGTAAITVTRRLIKSLTMAGARSSCPSVQWYSIEGHEDRAPANVNDLINRRVTVIAAVASNAAV